MNNSHNHQKKIALINDITGFGRCSVAVELPIISTMKVQCCFVPTAILSNHTGFESFYFDDYTDRMEGYIAEWKKLKLGFSGITSGFLGSARQINIVTDFIDSFAGEGTVVIIDPVMGDYGRIYSTYTDEMCQLMKKLVSRADIVTPNLTEGCILTDTPYHDNWHEKDLKGLTDKIMAMGPRKVVITGIQQGKYIANYCAQDGEESFFVKTMKVGTQRSGTGDIFASIIAADAVNGVEFRTSVKKASAFIKKCILKSIELDIPLTDGVCFEEVLGSLR